MQIYLSCNFNLHLFIDFDTFGFRHLVGRMPHELCRTMKNEWNYSHLREIFERMHFPVGFFPRSK